MTAKRKVELSSGEQITIDEAAELLGIKPKTVYTRLHYGRPLEAPKFSVKRERDKEPPCEAGKDVRYAQDIECRISRLVCGGECSLEQLALLWNRSHQYISLIEQRAFAKLRKRARWSADAREMLAWLDELRARRERVYEPFEHKRGLSSESNTRRAGGFPIRRSA